MNFGRLTYQNDIPDFFGAPVDDIKAANAELTNRYHQSQDMIDTIQNTLDAMPAIQTVKSDGTIVDDKLIIKDLMGEVDSEIKQFADLQAYHLAGNTIRNLSNKIIRSPELKLVNQNYTLRQQTMEEIDADEDMPKSYRDKAKVMSDDMYEGAASGQKYRGYVPAKYVKGQEVLLDVLKDLASFKDKGYVGDQTAIWEGMNDDTKQYLEKFGIEIEHFADGRVEGIILNTLYSDEPYQDWLESKWRMDTYGQDFSIDKMLDITLSPARLAQIKDEADRIIPAVTREHIEYSNIDLTPENREELYNAVEYVESRMGKNNLSRAGAIGPMQIMPDTAANPGYGLPPLSKEDLHDPEKNRAWGRMYLDAMLKEFNGDVEAALVAYNSGPGRAEQWIAAGRDPDALRPDGNPMLTKEGREYAGKVHARLGSGFTSKEVVTPEQRIPGRTRQEIIDTLIKEEYEATEAFIDQTRKRLEREMGVENVTDDMVAQVAHREMYKLKEMENVANSLLPKYNFRRINVIHEIKTNSLWESRMNRYDKDNASFTLSGGPGIQVQMEGLLDSKNRTGRELREINVRIGDLEEELKDLPAKNLSPEELSAEQERITRDINLLSRTAEMSQRVIDGYDAVLTHSDPDGEILHGIINSGVTSTIMQGLGSEVDLRLDVIEEYVKKGYDADEAFEEYAKVVSFDRNVNRGRQTFTYIYDELLSTYADALAKEFDENPYYHKTIIFDTSGFQSNDVLDNVFPDRIKDGSMTAVNILDGTTTDLKSTREMIDKADNVKVRFAGEHNGEMLWLITLTGTEPLNGKKNGSKTHSFLGTLSGQDDHLALDFLHELEERINDPSPNNKFRTLTPHSSARAGEVIQSIYGGQLITGNGMNLAAAVQASNYMRLKETQPIDIEVPGRPDILATRVIIEQAVNGEYHIKLQKPNGQYALLNTFLPEVTKETFPRPEAAYKYINLVVQRIVSTSNR
jgi:hypothetical protein